MEKVKPPGTDPRQKSLVLADRLHSAAIHLLRHVRRQDIATREGPARLSALSVLVFGGPKTLGELASAEQVRPPTMSRIVSGLARNRLVEITSDPGDSRRLCIRASPEGTRLLQEARQRRVQLLASRIEGLSPAELGALGKGAEVLQRILQDWR